MTGARYQGDQTYGLFQMKELLWVRGVRFYGNYGPFAEYIINPLQFVYSKFCGIESCSHSAEMNVANVSFLIADWYQCNPCLTMSLQLSSNVNMYTDYQTRTHVDL